MKRLKNETTMRPKQISLRNRFSEIEGRIRKWNTISNVQHANDGEFQATYTEPKTYSEQESKSTLEEKSVGKSNTDAAIEEEEGGKNGKELYGLKRASILSDLLRIQSFFFRLCLRIEPGVGPSFWRTIWDDILTRGSRYFQLESMTQRSLTKEVGVNQPSLSSYSRGVYTGHLQKFEGKLGIFVEKYLLLNAERIRNLIQRVRHRSWYRNGCGVKHDKKENMITEQET